MSQIVYASNAIARRMEMIRAIADTDASVLILGESGVGKNLCAEQIHLHSSRADKPFVRVNCNALPDSLLEKDLFGYVEDTDLNAHEYMGCFERNSGGTIFLDAIASISPYIQSKMLRFLQYQTFEKIGDNRSLQVDVRIIAATNQNMQEAVDEGTFRRDFYYRLNVLTLTIPPLRERREDILVLADHFLKRYNDETGKNIVGFTGEAQRLMQAHNWYGNVRELQNIVRYAVIMATDERICPDDMTILSQPSPGSGSTAPHGTLRDFMRRSKKQIIRDRLERNAWNKTATAKTLNVHRTYLSRLIKELGIAR